MTEVARLRSARAVISAAVALTVLGLGVTSGCGGGGTDDSSERPLTSREAALLAEVLVKNYRAGRVEFTVTSLDRPGGSTVRMEGRLDWTDHLGEAALSVDQGNAPAVVGWRRDVVLERWPQADGVLLDIGSPAAPVIARPPDRARRLDQIIAILVGLAGERPDNAQLVLQTEGSAFLREDELRGSPVVVLRYGTRNIYWLDAVTGEMLRFEARSAEGDLPIVVDILGTTSDPVALPETSKWVPVDAIAEFYFGLSSVV